MYFSRHLLNIDSRNYKNKIIALKTNKNQQKRQKQNIKWRINKCTHMRVYFYLFVRTYVKYLMEWTVNKISQNKQEIIF